MKTFIFRPTFIETVIVHRPRGAVCNVMNSCNTIPRFPLDSHLSTTFPLGSCVCDKKSDSRSSHRQTIPATETYSAPLALFSGPTPTCTKIFTLPLYGRLSNCSDATLILTASPGRYRDLSVWMKVETLLGLKRRLAVFVKSRMSPL